MSQNTPSVGTDQTGNALLALRRPQLQAKLLRFLQDETFRRVRGAELVKGDIRFICATNKEYVREDGTRSSAFRDAFILHGCRYARSPASNSL